METKLADEDGEDDKQLKFQFMISAPRSAATPISDPVKKVIFEMRAKGHLQSDIAAYLGTNQGRVSEVLRGLR